MYIKIKLNIISIDLRTGEFYTIINDGIPSTQYDIHNSIEAACSYLIKVYLELNPEWIDYILYKVTDEDSLSIEYLCIVPDKINIKYGRWVKVDNYELIQKIQEIICK